MKKHLQTWIKELNEGIKNVKKTLQLTTLMMIFELNFIWGILREKKTTSVIVKFPSNRLKLQKEKHI